MSTSTAIQVGLVDDHKLFRKGMIALLAESAHIHVCFEAGNGQELLEMLAEGTIPEVILLDISMPYMDGIEALKCLHQDYPGIKVLMLTMNQDDAMILHMMELGANGYLMKEADPDEVELAIRSVVEAGFFFNERVSRALLAKIVRAEKFKPIFTGMVQLSDREVEVLDAVCHGWTNPEIAEKLFISPRTVEGHRKKIMEKMGVNNTAGMVVYAIKHGWVDLDGIEV